MFGVGSLFPGLGGGSYEANYRAYPVAFIEKESAETGDKVILPPSALEKLGHKRITSFVMFQDSIAYHLQEMQTAITEGRRISRAHQVKGKTPLQMMQNLLLREGDLVNLKNVSLPKGTFVKIQPHTSDFLDISNPKAVLETSMRSFTCLTEGDTFVINYNGRQYHIDAIEVKPREAVSVVETDLSVDFAPPKDYKEPDYKALARAQEEQDTAAAMDTGEASTSAPASTEPEVPTFLAFGGSGNRLDGKAAAPSNPVAVPIAQMMRKPGDPIKPSDIAPTPRTNGNASGQKAGKVVFGEDGLASSNRLAARLALKSAAPKPPEPAKPAASSTDDSASKFAAFSGKARSLKD